MHTLHFNMTKVQCVLISEDIAFKSIIQRLLHIQCKRFDLFFLSSLKQLKAWKKEDSIDLVIIDDTVKGSAPHELITYLRYSINIVAPVYYFSQSQYEEKSALENGANYFFKKPFEPTEVTEHIANTIRKLSIK